MLDYPVLKRNRTKFLALTGLTVKEFESLLPAFSAAYKKRYTGRKTLTGSKRRRRKGGGRRGQLPTMEQKLLFILVYQKTYPLQVVMGELFTMSQTAANQWIHRLLPILQVALEALGVMPERNPAHFAEHERQQGESLDLTIDGTERRRQRPKNPKKQKLHYSGKKKTHTDKNVVITNTRTKRVGYLSRTYPGRTHDKMIADREAIDYPREATVRQDTGFQGYEPPVRQSLQPKKSRARANWRACVSESSTRSAASSAHAV
jgi:hypothetical protein